MSTTIRKLEKTDASAYREIRVEAVRDNPHAFYAYWEAEKDKNLAAFEAQLTQNVMYGAFDGEALIATAGFWWHANPKLAHKCTVYAVYTKPDYRGTGVSKRLLEALLKVIEARFEIALLGVEFTNAPAKKLYQSLGFTEYGCEKHSMKIGDRYSDEILMQKMF